MHTLTFQGVPPSSDTRGGDFDTALIDAVAIAASQPNQPFDPGFESPSVGSGGSAYQFDPTNSPWTFSGDAGVTGNASGYTASNPNAPQGSQVAFLQITGSASQSFYMAPGMYDVSLQAAQRGIGLSDQTIEVLVDGQLVSTITPSGTSYAFVHQRQLRHRRRWHAHTVVCGPRSLGRRQHGLHRPGCRAEVSRPTSRSILASKAPTWAPARQPISTIRRARLGRSAATRAWPATAALSRSDNPNAPQGSQVAFIQITGSASQIVTLAGGTYSISLDAAQRNAARQARRSKCWSTARSSARSRPAAPITGSIRPRRSTCLPAHIRSRFWGSIRTAATTRRLSTRCRFVAVQANQPLDPGFEKPEQGSDRRRTSTTRRIRLGRSAATPGVAGNGSGFTARQSQRAARRPGGLHSNDRLGEPIVRRRAGRVRRELAGRAARNRLIEADDSSARRWAARSAASRPAARATRRTPAAASLSVRAASHTLTFLGLDPSAATIRPSSTRSPCRTSRPTSRLDAGFESPFAGPGRRTSTTQRVRPGYSAAMQAWPATAAASRPAIPMRRKAARWRSYKSPVRPARWSRSAGGTYSISLDAAHAPSVHRTRRSKCWSTAGRVGSITPTGINYGLYTTTTFAAAAGTHTIEILGLDPQGGDNTALVDQVSIVAAQAESAARSGFRSAVAGRGPGGVPVRSDGLALGVQRLRGRGRQRQRLHGQQSQRAARRPGRVHPNDRFAEPIGRAGGRHYSISLEAAQRANGPWRTRQSRCWSTAKPSAASRPAARATPSTTQRPSRLAPALTPSNYWDLTRTAATTRPSSTRFS